VDPVSEVAARYGRIAEGLGSRLAGVRPDQWHAPTPCTEWDVRALVVHVIRTHRAVAASLTGEQPAEVDAEGDLVAQWGTATASIASALADPGLATSTVRGMFGEQSFESLVSRLLCADTLFHTWDLARATGQDEALDPDGVAKATEFLEPIDEAIRRPGGFAPRITPPPDADLQTRFLNFGGRVCR
jgi:uncharacterized protein (TIGR03086 family)